MDKLALIFITAAILSAPSHADSVYVGAWSKHLDGGDYNETHELIAVERRDWIAGTLINSFGDRTYMFGKGWDLATTEDWNFRVYAGASYGYRACDGSEQGEDPKVCPAIVPELSYTKHRVQPAIMLFGGAVALSVKFEF